MASSAVSCESRGGCGPSLANPQPRGPASASAGSLLFSFFCVEGVRVSQEWDEVVHEVRLSGSSCGLMRFAMI